MKKIIAVLIVFCITASLFALEEVRGVQTKKIEARNDDGSYGGENFEFKNDNNFPVSVEAELYYGSWRSLDCRDNGLKDVKSFNLAASETYVWKTRISPSSRCNCYVKYKAWKLDDKKTR